MGKRKNRSKRSTGRLPKGLPVRDNSHDSNHNPFETTHKQKKQKFQIWNRHNNNNNNNNPSSKPRTSALSEALQKRQVALRQSLSQKNRSNQIIDKRIGEYINTMSKEEQNLRRLVKERSARSKRSTKYSLNHEHDQQEDILTHGGQEITDDTAADHVVLDEQDTNTIVGELDPLDTELHFGGLDNPEASLYGGTPSMASSYLQKKQDLDDKIKMHKLLKLENQNKKESQVEAFEKLDASFAQLSGLLNFRDKDQEIREQVAKKRNKTMSQEEQELADWDMEMKSYLYNSSQKVKATDRTKTAEEIAQEEFEKLHELETRRLARMNGDFEDDDLSDIPMDNSVERLDNSDDQVDEKEQEQIRFTADGLVRINRDGVVIGKVGDEQVKSTPSIEVVVYQVGDKVTASYRANEQYDGNESWFGGKITKVCHDNTFDVEYDDGDYEEKVEYRHIRKVEKTTEELEIEVTQAKEQELLKRKRTLAKEKARSEIPFVFEVPTTLEALHDVLATFAGNGADINLIIDRIHKANSVRLDERNAEKMQNFYDVLLRRFILLGDAIFESGAGEELDRYGQLDCLTRTLYEMAQEAPESAAAVWSRRLGIFQNAHAKRLRDADLFHEDDDFTAWPSMGVILALRAMGHIFPVTDKRHHIATPTVLFLGQLISQCPILSIKDLVSGMLCCGLLIEYTKEAKRVAPEAHAFLNSTICLFSGRKVYADGFFPLPTVATSTQVSDIACLRDRLAQFKCGDDAPRLGLESSFLDDDQVAAAILYSAFHLVEVSVSALGDSIGDTDKEVFGGIADSLLELRPNDKKRPLPPVLKNKLTMVAGIVSAAVVSEVNRLPLRRRAIRSAAETAVKTLAPRVDNPERISLSRDKGKSATQAAADRARREYKREHKAVARELRLDGTLLEQERRRQQHARDSAAQVKRQKAFAWMEGEQATMNQQVRQGGGLLQGGGTGAARAKAQSGKLGIKKGGKF